MTEAVAVEVQKQVDSKNQIWFTKKDSKINIGFTQEFLQTVRECFHILPASKGAVRANSPLMAIEGCDSMFSVSSPASGRIVTFNEKASNFPDLLTDEDVIVVIDENAKAPARKEKMVAEPPRRAQAARPIPAEVAPRRAEIRGNNNAVFRPWGLNAVGAADNPMEIRMDEAMRIPDLAEADLPADDFFERMRRQHEARLNNLVNNNNNNPEGRF